MVVPVRRWANMALLGQKSEEEPQRTNEDKAQGHGPAVGFLHAFERLLTAHTDAVIRGLED